jgi:hypothetical protein
MTTILDYCVPSRRRERLERKEQLALASRVNPRWGDTQISAPSEGGWNQPGFFSEQEKDLPGLPGGKGSPQNSSSSVSTTPDLSVLYDKAIEAGISIEPRPEVVQLPQTKEERKNISFTITLPWPSRRVNSPPALSPPIDSPPLRSELAGTNSRPSTAQSSYPTTHIPASDRYVKDLATAGRSPPLMNPLAQSPPDRAVETFPVRAYAQVPDSYVEDVADLGLVPSPPLFRGPSPIQQAAIDPVLRRGRSPPLQHTSPIMRLEPIPATPYCVGNFSDDLRMERPEAVMPSHPAVTERRSRARSSSREPHPERYARMRSSSRGPAEDRVGSVRSSSRGPAVDRIPAPRSSSRGPELDRVGTGRSSSRGPEPDRVGTGRSSSRGPPIDRFGTGRSSSRGPPLDRVGRQRSTSMGPPAGRIAMVRSASREPTAERLAYRRAGDRDSFSSDSSSATLFSDTEDNTAMKHRRAPSISSTNYTDDSQRVAVQMGNAQTGGPGGYYTSLASEYRHIAKDVENQVVSETDSSDGKKGKGGKERKESKQSKKARKERLKEAYSEPQALVPSASDLYG